MNKFLGLPFVCLMFLSTYADPEIAGSSWSLQMSQNNGEPIQVQSERKEYDKTGVTLHRRTKGIIENGVYKPLSEQDLKNSDQRRSRDIDSLLRIADQYENEPRGFQNNGSKMRKHPRGFFGFRKGENSPLMKHHPRRYGTNFEKNEQRPRGFFEFENEENFPQVQQHPMERRSVRWGHPSEIVPKEQRHPMSDDSASDSLRNRLKNRSRVSFYRPVERMFEKIFGTKKKNFETENNFEKNSETPRAQRFRSSMSSPKKIHKRPPRMNSWDENVEMQNENSIEELLKSMQEFEDSFLFNERVEE